VARATHSESKFGAELDSLADVICFGAVPAFIIFVWGAEAFGIVGWMSCLAFAAASALRLARFNVSSADPAKPSWMANYFTGVPTPAGAFLAFVPVYVEQAGWLSTDAAATLALFCLPTVAVLMISNLPTFSAKSVSRKALRVVFLPSLLLSAVVIGGLLLAPWHTFALSALAYLASFPFSLASQRRRLKKQN
jgi:CDP-diacylglycerol--serine O-phosphatidyltransferase